MAAVATFKQACPSCEALISIKENMIGKKIECTKCKDKFIAERPEEDEDVAEEKDEKPAKKATKTDTKKNTSVSAKAPAAKAKDDDGKANGKPPQNKAKREVDDADVDAESDGKSKKKKKEGGGVSKLTIGIGLAVVGVLILSVAAFFLLSGNSSSGGGRANSGGPGAGTGPGKGGAEPEPDDKADPKKAKVAQVPEVPAIPLTDSELAKLTNLLPPDAEHVFHVFFSELFHPSSPLQETVFQASALNDPLLTKSLGFALSAIDDVLCAEKYTSPSWKYTILHFKENLKEENLKTVLKLTPVKTPINGQLWYQFAEMNPALETLGSFRIGIPNQLRGLEARSADRPSFVRIHNSQTLIIGDEVPIKALLTANSQFPLRGVKPAVPAPKPKTEPDPKQPGQNPNPMPGQPPIVDPTMPPMPMPNPNPNPNPTPGKQPGQATKTDPTMPPMPNANPSPNPKQNPQPDPTPLGAGGRDDFYATIRPTLKAMLERMETRNSDQDKVLFSSATDMNANRIESTNPEFNNMVVRRPRQVWDVTLLLHERKPRIRMLGTSLIQGEALKYQLRNELDCAQEIDAKEFQREMLEKSAHTISSFVKRWTNHEIKLAPPAEEKKPIQPNPNPNPNPNPGAIPTQKQEEKKEVEVIKSQISVTQEANAVEFKLELISDNWSRLAIEAVASLAASSLRGEIEAALNPSLRHNLANAGKQLAENGVSKQDVAAGQYPPGAFRRPDAMLRTDREPRNRISWMTALLPYMGHQNLFDRVKFDQSWRSPGNWSAGNTMVPQFLDPMYPDGARLIGISDSPLDYAATHYVGIAGVGLDAASYKRGDPATKHKQGILGYDDSAKLAEVSAGRGLANTILMIQVPHDGTTGVSPWIAGGGATLRGVPEKNSVAPFVLSTDRNGKPIHHQNKRGTYAMMSDGSVRFIDQNVSDEVFKAMCTMEGPNPDDFDLQKNPSTPLVPVPKTAGKAGQKTSDANSAPKNPSKEEARKKEANKSNDLSVFQGAWMVKSMEIQGENVPAREFEKLRITFAGAKYSVTGGDNDIRDAAFSIDLSAKPHQIEMLPFGLGIFEFSSGELKLNIAESKAGVSRPTEFRTKVGSKGYMMVLTKTK